MKKFIYAALFLLFTSAAFAQPPDHEINILDESINWEESVQMVTVPYEFVSYGVEEVNSELSSIGEELKKHQKRLDDGWEFISVEVFSSDGKTILNTIYEREDWILSCYSLPLKDNVFDEKRLIEANLITSKPPYKSKLLKS